MTSRKVNSIIVVMDAPLEDLKVPVTDRSSRRNYIYVITNS